MILFACNTNSQILNALNIRKNIYMDEAADLWIRYSKKTKDEISDIRDRIVKLGLFDNVYLYHSEPDYDQSLKGKLRKAKNAFLIKSELRKTLPNANKTYSKIFISGPAMIAVGLYYYYLSRNKNLELIQYEEGIFEYYMFNSPNQATRRLYSKIVFGAYYLDRISKLFVYKPELVSNPSKRVECCSIPVLDSDNKLTKEEINTLFFYRADERLEKKKYIFIEQKFPSQEDLEKQKQIIRIISESIDSDQMTIKLHPGSDESDYSEFSGNAIKTPYSMEVMDINHDSAWDIIFTQCSSAAFNSYLVCGKHPVIVLLYKIINSDFISDGMIQFMESFRRNCTDVRVLVPTDMDELKIVLKSL